jgi:hypothetical protein
VRLRSALGTTDFVIELARLNAQPKTDAAPQRRQAGSLGALVAGYRGSPEFTRLAERTRADYQRVFNYLAPLDGLPLVQLDGAAVIEIRDRAYAHRKRRFANHVLQVLGTVLNWGRPQPRRFMRWSSRKRNVPRTKNC